MFVVSIIFLYKARGTEENHTKYSTRVIA